MYNNRDLDGLRKLYDACETHYRPLEAQGVNVSTYSSIVVPTIMEKLPEMFRLTITREREFLEWSMKELLEAMTKEIELREAHHAVINTSEGNPREESRIRRKDRMVIVPPLHYWLDNNKILRSLYQDVPTVYKNMIPTIALKSKVL